MELGDFPALIASASAFILGLLAFIVPTAKDRAAAKRGEGAQTVAVEQGRTVDVETYTDDYIELLREHGKTQAALAESEAERRSLMAERARLLASIGRRDDKIELLEQRISHLGGKSPR